MLVLFIWTATQNGGCFKFDAYVGLFVASHLLNEWIGYDEVYKGDVIVPILNYSEIHHLILMFIKEYHQHKGLTDLRNWCTVSL